VGSPIHCPWCGCLSVGCLLLAALEDRVAASYIKVGVSVVARHYVAGTCALHCRALTLTVRYY
jgi:hypothetical protein